MIDLHLHSTASDGTLAPAAVVRRAAAARLSAIALTDHDTFAGIAEAKAEGRRAGIEVIAGVELSLEHGPGTFHLLGLFTDPDDPDLAAALARLIGGRDERNRLLAERLTELGMPLTVDEVAARAGGEVVARPHFAASMVARGYAATEKEAFDRWLGKGAAAYVERERPTAAEAIRLVHGAGGVAVLCHPETLRLSGGRVAATEAAAAEFLARLAAEGLDAVEVRRVDHDAKRTAFWRAAAKRAGLLESGGSDYHGRTKQEVKRGIGGRLGIPDELLAALRERAARIRAERNGGR